MDEAEAAFREKLLAGLMRDVFHPHAGAVDYNRFGMGRKDRLLQRAKDTVLAVAAAAGFARRPSNLPQLARNVSSLLERSDDLAAVHSLLADDYSKDVFVDVLRYRAVGSHRVRLTRNTDAYWRTYRSVDSKHRVEKSETDGLSLYEVAGAEGPIRMRTTQGGVLNGFLLEQYRYRRGGVNIGAESGYTVIEGGACWGDTALYFADKVGPGGKVFAFEFDTRNVGTLRANLAANARLGGRVEVVPLALWNESGASLRYEANGPATTLARDANGQAGVAETVRIDDFVKSRNLTQVGFVKMDIEGAETAALRGAEETLRRFRPKLAISLYHSDSDFTEIPLYLDGLGLGYRFYLDHFTVHREETVLFAAAHG